MPLLEQVGNKLEVPLIRYRNLVLNIKEKRNKKWKQVNKQPF